MELLIGILILILASVGNAEWWVVLVNRRHSIKAPHAKLLRIRLLHDIGILTYPVLILFLAGLGQDGLLSGGSFLDLPLPVQGILAVSFAGLVPFFYSVLRWQFRRTTKRLLHLSSERFDSLHQRSQEDADRIRGDHSSMLLRIPYNEIFQLEVNQKRIAVRPTPDNVGSKTSSTIRVAHFSDMHLIGCPGTTYHEFVAAHLCRLQPDMIVFTGDLLDRQYLLPQASRIFQRLASVAPGYFVLGNHDWQLDYHAIRNALIDAGWTSVAQQSFEIEVAGHPVLIAGTEAPWIGENPEVAPRGDEHLRILLSHTPDQRDFADKADFDVMLCGHNHGGQIILPLIGPVYSPSIYGVRYSGGLFEYRDLLIHVTRGVGAKDLLRWNCPPEISLLEFEFQAGNA